MAQPKPEPVEWLSLSAAARRLNVHPATLRRWADEDQVPFMRTPGGHRRFAASDIARLARRQTTATPHLGPVEKIWAGKALEQARAGLATQRAAAWLERLDPQARKTHRRLGQELLDLILRYLTGEEESGRILADAEGIGEQYVEIAVRYGLSLTQLLKAFMLFRDALVSTAVELPKDVRITAASRNWMNGRIGEVLDTVQLAIVGAYERRLTS